MLPTERSARAASFRLHLVALMRRLRQSAEADSETWTGLMILGTIERLEGAATPSLISTEMELRSSNVAAILRELERRNLITRSADPHDKRMVRLALTPTGSDFVKVARAKRDTWLLHAMADCLSDEEQERLLAAGELMSRLASWRGSSRR